MINNETEFFFSLTPDIVIESMETLGFQCTGYCAALNSFENRVYEVELEVENAVSLKSISEKRRVVKFYRPGRWTEEQILEEHEFEHDLLGAEIPVIAPIRFDDGKTLHKTSVGGIFYAVFPKVGGRAPDELNDDQLKRIGRYLGRIHNVGAVKQAKNRIILTPDTYGRNNLRFLLEQNWIPVEFQNRYKEAVEKICDKVDNWFQEEHFQRLHGDCHLGNLLWNDRGPFFLDFDDMVMGPPVQDIWLLMPGRDQESFRRIEVLLSGYEEMRAFDRKTLKLIEPLRALRFVHYASWVAKRWEDPAFPAAFPYFNTHRYWSDETEDLEEQMRLISELN